MHTFLVFPSFVTFIFGLVCLFFGMYMRKADSKFEENAKRTKAYIIGYRTKDGSQWDYPIVRFFDEGKEVSALCETGGIKASFYPPGTELDIYYMREEGVLGVSYKARAIHDRIAPVGLSKVGNFMLILSAIFFTITLVLVALAAL